MLRQIVQDNLNKIACFGMRKAFLLRPYFFCEPCPVTRSGRSDLTKFSSPPPHESTSQIDKWKKKNDSSFSSAVTHSLALYGHRLISDPKLSQEEEKLITHFITPPTSCLHTQPALFLSQPTQPSETHESECLHPTLEIRAWARRWGFLRMGLAGRAVKPTGMSRN